MVREGPGAEPAASALTLWPPTGRGPRPSEEAEQLSDVHPATPGGVGVESFGDSAGRGGYPSGGKTSKGGVWGQFLRGGLGDLEVL